MVVLSSKDRPSLSILGRRKSWLLSDSRDKAVTGLPRLLRFKVFTLRGGGAGGGMVGELVRARGRRVATEGFLEGGGWGLNCGRLDC